MTETAGEGASNKVGHVSGYAGLLQLDGGVDVAHKPPCAEEANEAEHQENGEGTHEVVAKVEGRLPMAQMKGWKRKADSGHKQKHKHKFPLPTLSCT